MSHDLQHMPSYFHNLASREREISRITEMARQLSHSMIDTGFAAQDVAMAFMQVGMTLAADISEREGQAAPDMTALLHRSVSK
jgi:peptide deformylase